MCGSKPKEPYSAYKSGDFQAWQKQFNKIAEIELAAARGEISPEQAQKQIDAIKKSSVVESPVVGQLIDISQNAGMSRSSRGDSNVFDTDPVQSASPEFLQRILGGSTAGDLASLENKIKEDPSAAMEMRELLRQHKVNLGKIGIDQAFSKFDDDYYKKYRDDYTGYYFPQLDEQYGKVTDKMTAILADRGILSSSIGSNKFADLAKEHSNARTNISNEALDAANKLRAQVESAKSNLYSLNEASADPQAINAQAIGQATALVAPPTYSPLGNIFAGALDAFGNYMSARQNRPYQNRSMYISPYPTGYGSGRVVR